jgi:hypothetical protein
MMPPTAGSVDPGAHAEVLRLLTPVADRLAAANADPPTVASHDWRGPAAEACRVLETELRVRLAAALVELDGILLWERSRT